MVVYVADVLSLQLVAEVVDFVLQIERQVDVVVLLTASHQHIHVGESLVGEGNHLIKTLVLLIGEVLLLVDELAVDGACQVVARVTDTLQLAHFAKHCTNLAFGIVAKVCIAHLLEVLANFQFHVIADAFVLLDARIEFVQVGLAVLVSVQCTRRQVKQFLHHAEHTLHAFCKRRDLLLGLEY